MNNYIHILMFGYTYVSLIVMEPQSNIWWWAAEAMVGVVDDGWVLEL